jgi:hypothetical protein
MVDFFIQLQIVLFFFMILHDWVELRPFTDLQALKKAHSTKERLFGSFINGLLVLVPLALTIYYRSLATPLWAKILFVLIYGLITFGTVTAWWIPYFTGKYLIPGNKAGFEEYRNTHTFLPKRGQNVVPNTLHVVLHLIIWTCFIVSVTNLFIG